jgi:pSer/pThr/pTyr-binding forkhead associated (FHA) protein
VDEGSTRVSAQQVAKRSSKSKGLPVFKVAADKGTHPPVQLDRAVCVVGRRGSAHLPLNAPQVSKVHALIVREEGSGQVYVRDLASTNGVEVNGAKVNEATLGDQDTLRIGAYTLRCESGFGERNGTTDEAAAPAARLSVDGHSMEFPRDKHTLLIGQRASCDIRLEDASVAPVHAVLFELDGRHYVRAFEAPGGTKLNGQPVEQQQELSPGDELRVGKFAIHYERAAGPAALASEESRSTPVVDHHEDEALSGDELVDLAMTGEIEPDASHSTADVIEMGESGIAEAVRETPRRIPPAGQRADGAAAVPPVPVEEPAEAAAELEVELEPLEVHEDVQVELEPAPIESRTDAAGELTGYRTEHAPAVEAPVHARATKPVDEVRPALTPPVATPKPAPAPVEAVADAEEVRIEVDDGDDLTDITPFDLGPTDAPAEAEAPYVDEVMEATFGAALKFDAATVDGGGEDALASLVMPSEDETDLSATFDESAALAAVSPDVEAPYEKPAVAEAPSLPAASAGDARPEPLAAVEDEHDDDDDLDLVELASPSGRAVDEMAATLDEAEPRDDGEADSPLAVAEDDAIAGEDAEAAHAPPAANEGEAPTQPVSEPTPVAESAAAAGTGSQAARLEELAEQAGLTPARADGVDAPPPPSIEEIGAMLNDVVAKVEALKSAWAAYQAGAPRDAVAD